VRFKFCEHPQHVQKGFPGGALGVDRLFGRAEGDAAFLEQVHDVLEVFDTARQAVHAGDDEGIPAPEKLQQQRQIGQGDRIILMRLSSLSPSYAMLLPTESLWRGAYRMAAPVNASIVEHFQTLEDPRIERTKKHHLLDILVIALCTLLTGGEGFQDMELFGKSKRARLPTFFGLPYGIPSHYTLFRVFAPLYPRRFQECFLSWT